MRLLYSSRTWDDVIYRDELETLGVEVVHTLTREQPPDWKGYARRIDDELLREVAFPAAESPRVYVCGSTHFVDAAADGLVRLGYDPLLDPDRALRSDGLMESRVLDGNAIGGLLLELFGTELTAAPCVCGSCGAREEMARLDVYVDCPGVVVRCRHCANVMITIVQRPRAHLGRSRRNSRSRAVGSAHAAATGAGDPRRADERGRVPRRAPAREGDVEAPLARRQGRRARFSGQRVKLRGGGCTARLIPSASLSATNFA